MRDSKFQELIGSIDNLTPSQRQRLLDKIGNMEHEQGETRLLERADGSLPQCPHCGTSDPVRWGQSQGVQRFRCRKCGRTFNLLTGTPLARLRYKERWREFAEAMREGKSIRKSAELSGIHRNTSFRWQHRFLNVPARPK